MWHIQGGDRTPTPPFFLCVGFGLVFTLAVSLVVLLAGRSLTAMLWVKPGNLGSGDQTLDLWLFLFGGVVGVATSCVELGHEKVLFSLSSIFGSQKTAQGNWDMEHI